MSEPESRFEVLEEETHFPATHPKSVGKQAENQEAESLEEKEEETLEQQLERLVLSLKKDEDADAEEVDGQDATKDTRENVKKASGAKELGNKWVAIKTIVY